MKKLEVEITETLWDTILAALSHTGVCYQVKMQDTGDPQERSYLEVQARRFQRAALIWANIATPRQPGTVDLPE